jgi:hypothetical protein
MNCEAPSVLSRRMRAPFPALRQFHRRFDGELRSPIDGDLQLRGAVRIPLQRDSRSRRPVSCKG